VICEAPTALTLLLAAATLLLTARTVLGPTAGPGGPVFALLIIVLLAGLAGKLVLGLGRALHRLSGVEVRVPALLGHLAVGVLLQNVPYSGEASIGRDLDPDLTRAVRTVCLTVILLIAGLKLDPIDLRRFVGTILRASIVPCIVEAGMVALLANLILGFPWTVGLMVGFALHAVSPAIIISSMLVVAQQGYGVEKGIHTLVIATCCASDVVAIAGFGVFFGLALHSDGPVWRLVLTGPAEALAGVCFGAGWGLMAGWLPNSNQPHGLFFR
jgi:Kef-type K+ transport system membrane component KefB